jgi:hypothetical protein
MVHPSTGETITSYKHLMNNPKTAKMWETAFGKGLGGMAQGDYKTGQKGPNSVFVMTWVGGDWVFDHFPPNIPFLMICNLLVLR